jgi:hypothetical protein
MACYGTSCRKEITCSVCGTLILASRNAKTCIRKCADIQRTGLKYKQGRSTKDKVKSQRALKLRLIQKRGQVCEKCSYARPALLEVHHKDRNKTYNELENLELICPNCHAEEHYLEKSWLNDKVVNQGGVG